MDDPNLPPPPSSDFTDTLPPSGEIPPAERQWAMFTHISGIFPVLGPLIIWMIKKDEMPGLKPVAYEAMNFGIGIAAVQIIGYALSFLCIPWLIAIVVYFAAVVLHIMAGLKAQEGVFYMYPANLRLIK